MMTIKGTKSMLRFSNASIPYTFKNSSYLVIPSKALTLMKSALCFDRLIFLVEGLGRSRK